MARKIRPLRFAALVALLLQARTIIAQQDKTDSSYATDYYEQRTNFFRQMPDRKNEIVFLGNSITEKGEWAELLRNYTAVNRGIGGDNTFGVLARLDEVLSSKPKKIFLLIGINDIGRGMPVMVIAANYRRIIQRVKTTSPRTKLFIQSVLPLNDSLLAFHYLKGAQSKVLELNKAVKLLCEELAVIYIDLHQLFSNNGGTLSAEFTSDGIHLNSIAYIRWVAFLKQQKHL